MNFLRIAVSTSLVIFPIVTQVGFASPADTSGKQADTRGRLADANIYLMIVEKQVDKAWVPPLGYESKRVIITFNIDRSGKVSDIAVERSSGVAVADQAAVKAIRSAAPFPPPPASWPSQEKYPFQWTFDRYVRERRKQVFQHF